jgi:hypothetical protein
VVQTDHARISCFGIDLDGRIVSTHASTPSQVRGNLRSWKSATPAATLDRAQEVFDLCIEGERLFQIDGVAGIGTDPQARIGKPDLSIRLVSRQRTSSSPTASNTGTVISES